MTDHFHDHISPKPHEEHKEAPEIELPEEPPKDLPPNIFIPALWSFILFLLMAVTLRFCLRVISLCFGWHHSLNFGASVGILAIVYIVGRVFGGGVTSNFESSLKASSNKKKK